MSEREEKVASPRSNANRRMSRARSVRSKSINHSGDTPENRSAGSPNDHDSRDSGSVMSKRSRSKTEIARGVRATLPPPSREGQQEDSVVNTVLCVRYKYKFAFMPGKPESIWKPHDVKLHVPKAGQGIPTLSLTKIAGKKQYKVGQATEGIEVEEDSRTKVFPLHKLDLVDRGTIPLSEAVKFDVLDENGNPTPEWRYGSLLFILMFAFEQEYVRLELCCNSTDERDLWAQWFTEYIVNSELNDIREDRKPVSNSSPQGKGVIEGIPEVSEEDDLAAIIDRPTAGVQAFMIRFLAGGQTQNEEDTDPSELPDKGKVLQLLGAQVAKRKLVCPETGTLLVKDSLGFLTKQTVDLEHALVQVESPWQPAFSVKLLGLQAKNLKKGDDILYFKCTSIGARQKMVDWLIGMRGVTQSNAETYNEEEGDDRITEAHSQSESRADDEEEERAPIAGSMVGVVQPDAPTEKKQSAEQTPMMGSDTKAEASEEKENIPTQQQIQDEKMMALMAYPIDTVVEGDTRSTADQPLRGEWCRVQYHRLGQRPTSKSAFEKRFVTIDPKLKRLTVLAPNLRSKTPALVDLDLATDVTGISTMSMRFGLLAITFHCKTQPIVVHMVPPNARSKHDWIDLLTGKHYNVPWFKEQLTEDVESSSFTRSLCYLCAQESKTTPVCRATMLQHGEFLESVKNPSDIRSIFETLPPRSVKPTNLQDAIERTERLLVKAKLHRQRASEALAVA